MKNLHYQFDFSRYRQHLIDVKLTFIATQDNPTLWLPVWIAGSYLIREFARHITSVQQQIDQQWIKCNKINKNHWQTQAKAGDHVTINYEVYAYDLSVRGAYVDQTRLYGNFSALAITVLGQEQQPILVDLCCPMDFITENQSIQLATALPQQISNQDTQTIFQLTANHYEALIDNPFEIANQAECHFQIVNHQQQTIPHRFVVSGYHHTNLTRLENDLTKICQSYVNWLEDTPFDDYLFLTMATGNDYGGLEHLSSTSLITPRNDLPSFFETKEPSEPYQRFLGLCSHEYFHAWWVKTVRPDVMMNPNFHQENYTELLWVFEGFTSYIDDFMLQKSGVISTISYLKLLNAQINRYQQNAGRLLQSVADSSFDTWIKLYRADENTSNAGVSYYNKGALVALCLDLLLLQHGKRLFQVIKACYQMAKQQSNRQLGLSNDRLDEIMGQFLPVVVWQDFKQKYVHGVAPLPLQTLLNAQGIAMQSKKEPVFWGLKFSTESHGLKVQQVARQSQASRAGIAANDVIIAIDHIKATEAVLKSAVLRQLSTNETIRCHLFRRDELLIVDVPILTENDMASYHKCHLMMFDETKAHIWLLMIDG